MGNDASMPSTIARALRLVGEHPSTLALGQITLGAETGTVDVEVSLRVSMPNAWMAEGRSPDGVRAVEVVTLSFPKSYPLAPPTVHLRRDFERSLAHIQPGPPTDAPVPCIYDGDLRELLQRHGLAGILNQLVLWLEHAALGRLIDPDHGWEPVRRDSLIDSVIADGDHLRSLVLRRENHGIFPLFYWRGQFADGSFGYHATLGQERLSLDLKNPGLFFGERAIGVSSWLGHSLAIVAWPAAQSGRASAASQHYQPETVTDVGGLLARSEEYGCDGALRSGLAQVKRCFLSAQGQGTLPLAIILLARRPFNLIHTTSNLEICPYLVELTGHQFFAERERTRVRPTGLRHAIAVPLLRRMSGEKVDAHPPPWVLAGAGSLGSKVALHLARAGHAPAIVIDKQTFNPHNAARHALVPVASALQLSWSGSKAQGLVDAISGLGQKAEAYVEDVAGLVCDGRRALATFPRDCSVVVNATASLAVREAFASLAPSVVAFPRVVETSLFAAGRVGLITVEGPGRNPDTGDLIAEAYELMRRDPALRRIVFPEDESVRRQEVGEGCGSVTTVMTDARISMFAAPVAEFILGMRRAALPEAGRILIGALAADDMSLVWTTHVVETRFIVDAEGESTWRVRISERAHQKMDADVAQWAGRETGGILVGRVSEAARTFYVTDVLPAPEDCQRSAAEFVLGVRGVRSRIAAYAESCNSSLYCLGTWHSHLIPSGPSARDRKTARAVAQSRIAPSVLLIHTPAGYRALLAEDE